MIFRDTGLVIGASSAATALTMTFVLVATPADACHRFHTWRYPYPQRCGLSAPAHVQAPQDRSYYVEIVERDTRTPEQITDYDEHNFAVIQHHDDINRMMIILHAEEDAARAAGLKQ